MASGRPPGSHPPAGRNGDLLQLEENNNASVYNTGQHPPVDDDRLLEQYNIDDSEQPRPSVSYDDFVGARNPAAAAAPHNAGLHIDQAGSDPYLGEPAHRTYSQTSGLSNFQRYSDVDDFEDDHMHGYYNDLDEDNIPSGRIRQQHERNSILGLGGGFMGKAKNMLGMGSEYSEMDLPLTEAGARGSRLDADGGAKPAPKKSAGSGFRFGRRKVDPATLGPRIIMLNNAPANSSQKFLNNYISTAKYNVITFIPKFLYEQFSKYANLFFLFTAALQQIPNVTPTNRYTTIVPLCLVLFVSAIKELVEDYKRRSSDTLLNTSQAQVLKGSQFQETKWLDVAVGDIIRVESEQPFPADLVLLASSEPEGLCYIETANLDGETNLKVKQAIPETSHLVNPSDLSRLSGRMRSEQPNSSLYTYEATLTMHAGGGEKELPLSPEQLLLRGATLRNTPWIHGVVVFTGHETKLMRNATATPIKRTAVEHTVNLQILILVGILIALSVITSVGDLIIRKTSGSKLGYLDLGSYDGAKQFFMDIATNWVLFSNLVPISLFVTIEIVKYFQALLINSDLDIYYDKTDTPAICRTSSLVEELGQIEYIFSDKTGTLTCNMMEFKQCSIGGIQYGGDIPEDRKAAPGSEIGVHDFKQLQENLKSHPTGEIIHEFLALLATCHTVIPERRDDRPGEIKYQAASPDEGALVEGAVMLGYQFTNRKPRAVQIVANDQEYEYELLAVCEFNSTRKRMSTIYRCPDGKVRVYCKGADTVILERLHPDNPTVEVTLQHLEEYATEGLRTLCLAMREVPEEEFQQWVQIHEKAATTVSGNRQEELDKAAELIEKDFYLLGATAIEDRLQDGVPDTIHTLQQAGIKVWVLTGDRQETAINIGMSCKLISEDMSLLIVNEESSIATGENLAKKLSAAQSQIAHGAEMEPLALIIDGKSLTFALEKDMEKMFLDLAVLCKAVICCRVSPLQKALVVKLVKRHKKSLLLAIGDGANDVSMIQAAHVGVGISGVEGLQAARAADVSIGQFRYLRKLLLVHGSWSYHRISQVILFSFYKNIALNMTQFWYSFQDAFSGEVIYESWTLTFFNVIFTVMPPFALGIVDQFVSARLLDRYPQLYQLGQKGVFFRIPNFWSWILNGFYHSLIAYIIGEGVFYDDLKEKNGMATGHWVWGTSMYTAVLVTVLCKASLITNWWTKYHLIAIPGSLLLWIVFLPAYGYAAPAIGFSMEYHGIIPVVFSIPQFYLMAFLIPVICLLRDFVWKYAKHMYWPQPYHHVQEIQKYNVQDYRPRMEQFQKAIRKVRQVQRMRKQRGYAFSQADEGGQQMRIVNAYDTTKSRGRYGEMGSSRPLQ